MNITKKRFTTREQFAHLVARVTNDRTVWQQNATTKGIGFIPDAAMLLVVTNDTAARVMDAAGVTYTRRRKRTKAEIEAERAQEQAQARAGQQGQLPLDTQDNRVDALEALLNSVQATLHQRLDDQQAAMQQALSRIIKLEQEAGV